MNLAQLSFRNSRGILLLALFLSILGVLAARQMPAAILPDFPFPRLVIIVSEGDMAIQDMVLRITRPLEAAAAGVPGAKLVRSKTARGSLELSVDFDWGTDMFEAFTRLNANVSTIRTTLPRDASVQIEWVNPSSFPVIGYSLTSDRLGPRDLREIADLNLAPYLSRLNGIYRVSTQGGQVREFQVMLDPAALAATGISPEQVSTALSQTNLIQSVGRFSRHYQGYLVLVDSQTRRKEDLLNVVLTSHAGKVVRVGDVATVREGEEQREQLVTADGREAVLLNILKQPGASTAEVSAEVKGALAQLRSSVPGVTITPFYDEADLLHESLSSLQDSILVGAVLAFIVLLLFLRSWRTTLVVLICLPITVLIAFLGLKLLHQTLNLMTLGGLAVGLGLIIDDVVVTLENIYRHAEMGKSPRDAALDGATEIQKPMIGSSLTAVAVFLPLAFLSEITGALFAPLSITLTLLLLASVILAVTLVPLITARLLTPIRAPAEPHAEKDTGPAARLYGRTVRLALDHPLPVLAAALGLSLVAAALVPTLPTGLMPDMDEGAFVMDFMAPGGTPLQTTDQQVRIIEQELRATPEVAAYSRRTGLEMGFFTTEPNRGDLMVKLKSHAQRKRSMRDVMEDVEKRCAARLPGMTLETMAPIADRVADIAGEPTPIQIKIFGDDPAVLKRLGDQVNEVVASIRGTSESVHGANLTGPELSIRVDPRRAGMLGLTPQDVAAALEAEIEGREDTSVVIGERVIGVRVMYPRRFRRTLEELRQLKLLSKDHRQVPLSAIADFKEVPGVYEVLRENQKPVSVVSAALTGRDVGSANREAQQKIAEKVPLPPGYTVQFGGLYATQQASFAGLLGVLLLGMFLVYLVTLFQYNRFGEPTALVLAALFALVGVVAALKLTGTLLNASSLTGAIMIFGMVLTNGIVLMDTIQARTAEGLPLAEAIIAAGQQRLRPVFMTASIAVLALLPLAFGIGSGAEMQQPLAVAVIGGLVVSPFFALLLAPLLLYVLRRGR
jgi:CzcA family heavy metal efflux pump